MTLTNHERGLAGFTLTYLIGFSVWNLMRKDTEFLIYAVLIAIFLTLLVLTRQKHMFPLHILWGLSLWGFFHLAGGSLYVNDQVIYGLQLIPRWVRFDQFVHAFGFGLCTLIGHHFLIRYIPVARTRLSPVLIFSLFFGLGLGALNETLEFVLVLNLPETNVGGYLNTGYDLVFNLLGSSLAVVVLFFSERSRLH